MIAVPTRGWIHHKVASALCKLEAQGFPVVFSASSYGVEAARKKLMKYFIDFKSYNRMLFLDDDIIAPSDIVARLLKHGLDFVSASYPIVQDGKTYDSSALKNGRVYKKMGLSNCGLVDVDACGLGACMMSRRLAETVFDNGGLVLEYDINGEVIKGEDYQFCEVAKHCDFDIHVDFSIQCEHLKYIPIGKVVI